MDASRSAKIRQVRCRCNVMKRQGSVVFGKGLLFFVFLPITIFCSKREHCTDKRVGVGDGAWCLATVCSFLFFCQLLYFAVKGNTVPIRELGVGDGAYDSNIRAVIYVLMLNPRRWKRWTAHVQLLTEHWAWEDSSSRFMPSCFSRQEFDKKQECFFFAYIQHDDADDSR